VCKEALYVFVK